jgi:hypothetical protein
MRFVSRLVFVQWWRNVIRMFAIGLGYSISLATTLFFVCCFLLNSANNASAQHASNAKAKQDQQELSKRLANPISSLISVPIQFNYEDGIGLDGYSSKVTFQPVIPFVLNEGLTLVSRTITSIAYQDDIFPNAGNQFGLGDTVQSFFLSPSPLRFGDGGTFIYGAGPVFLLPTGTDELLSAEKWGAGPTAIGLAQKGPYTGGALFSHIWSFAGSESRSDVSSTLIQPFFSYRTPEAVTFALESETTYDWETDEWAVPINFTVSKIIAIGKRPVSLGIGARYWVNPTTDGPDGWGLRAQVTFLFPKF